MKKLGVFFVTLLYKCRAQCRRPCLAFLVAADCGFHQLLINFLQRQCRIAGHGDICLDIARQLAGIYVDTNQLAIDGDRTSEEEVNTTTEDQLKDEGMTSEYFFMPDGKVKLISNMTGSGNLETMEGTWKLAEDKLTFSLMMEENPVDITWDFEFKDDVIHLTRSSPDGSTSVVNSFKRK